jgi:hypothetical protein
VHALGTLHSALRPRGLLLDVRPAEQHPWVELRRRGAADHGHCIVRLGQIDDSYRHRTLTTANAALRTVIDAGQFARICTRTFTFVYHFDSVETWLAYMEEHWYTARLSPELIARAREEPPEDTDEIRVLRVIRAARLLRME